MTEADELVGVILRINKLNEPQADESLLRQAIALVVRHPLDSDRGPCQAKIAHLIVQKAGVKGNATRED